MLRVACNFNRNVTMTTALCGEGKTLDQFQRKLTKTKLTLGRIPEAGYKWLQGWQSQMLTLAYVALG